MEFSFALDLIFVPLLGIITVCGLYCAVRALVRRESGFGRWLGFWGRLIMLAMALQGAYSCYTSSEKGLRRYEDFMANGVLTEGSVITSVHNPGGRKRSSRFDTVILYRTEAGTPYYHNLRSGSRREAQEKVALRYKPENPQEVLIMGYDTSARSAWVRRVLSYILAGLALVALVMLWSCARAGRESAST